MILNIKYILSNKDEFDHFMKNRNETIRSTDIEDAYIKWRDVNLELEDISAQLNRASKSFDKNKITHCKELTEKRKLLEKVEHEKKNALEYIIERVPNILDDVPLGKDSSDNMVIDYFGTKPEIHHPVHHEDIAKSLHLWGRDEAVEMSGSRFVLLTGKLAKLERVLGQHVLNMLLDKGFMEMSVPYIVKENSMYNTGQLPKFSGEYFSFEDRCLISTGEIPLLNYFANKTLDNLPIKVTTLSPCFRKEAGSLGKDTKGLIRLHQFHKVEMIAITKPEESHSMHKELLNQVKEILDILELHYRVIEICSGDIGFTAQKQFDIEVWMPSQNNYVEVASCSNCGEFQARRMKTKHIKEDGSKEFVHTLNSTALACGRIIAAILENHCHAGEFVLPKVLQKYFQ